MDERDLAVAVRGDVKMGFLVLRCWIESLLVEGGRKEGKKGGWKNASILFCFRLSQHQGSYLEQGF